MIKTTEVRYEPTGHRVRTFTVWSYPQHDKIDVRIGWGASNPDTIAELVRKFGAREISLIIPNHERWYRIHTDGLAVRQRTWRNACKRDGLTIIEQWEDR